MPEDTKTTDEIETKNGMEYGDDMGYVAPMGPNYVLDFEELDALEEIEAEKERLLKRGKQFLSMLGAVQSMDDLNKIRDGMGRMMRKAGYMKPVPMDMKAAPMKTEGGVAYPKSDFAYTPSDEVSTWKLRLAEGEPGKITRSQLGAAAAALSPGGFRGNRVELPSSAVSGVKARIRQEYAKLGVDEADMPASVKEIADPLAVLKERGSFELYKDGDQLRWLGVYSNNFRDNDYPPEIISKESHKFFEDMVDKGQAEYPELWYWHTPGTRFGVADFVAFDDSGFALASGTIDKGMEAIAKAISQAPNQAMSHGMPYVKRSKDDPSIIVEHITTEISVLPFEKAANKLTHFIMNESEEKNMSLPKDKAEALAGLGFNVEEIQRGLEAKAKDAVEAGIEYKETEQVEAEVSTEEAPQVAYVTRQEFDEFAQTVVATVANSIKELKEELKTTKQEAEAEQEKQLQATPAASFMAAWQSAIGSTEAKIDGREKLAKAQPEQAEDDNPYAGSLPSIVGQLKQQSLNGWNQ